MPSSLSNVASLKSKWPERPAPAFRVWVLQWTCRKLVGKSGLKKGPSDLPPVPSGHMPPLWDSIKTAESCAGYTLQL